MYLKSLEMTGFKSFADKTRLEFEPGMTAIVGPNGCGKSNVSDAVRWVLGEQSAKALRGSKMEDCIFNGTDGRKPLGMAEVCLTLADCEKVLSTEYNEMTVTRRVFRSGEGQYFINKTPCRLKDIERMFMDTGIGTTSYSFMEQGRIDRILSSRPEDRRAIFEEVSGITKFKADKKEAIRKLEHTEGNLVRLSDVIREVKRQIGSLQRQAGKARRYKAFKEELRNVDIFTTRERLKEADKEIQNIEAEISALNGKLNATQREVEELEEGNTVLRESLMQTERERGAALEATAHSQSKLDHARDLIHVNKQRIEEYRGWSERDSREISEIKRQIQEKRSTLQELLQRLENARSEQNDAERELKVHSDNLEKHENRIKAARSHIQALREESVELESLNSRLQNQLVEIESRERSSVIRKERLAAEKTQLAQVVSTFDKRQTEMTQSLANMREEVAHCEKALRKLEELKSEKADRITELQEKCSNLQSQSAEKKARIELLSDDDLSGTVFPAGSQLLLDDANPLDIDKDRILGALASHLDIEQAYQTALEAALRSWADAVLVADSTTALDILRQLETRKEGPARLLAVDMTGSPALSVHDGNGARLIEHLKCSENVMPLIQRLIGNVLVIDSLDAVPSPIPADSAYVTRNGCLVRGDGCLEFWMTDTSASNPMSRKHALSKAETGLTSVEKQLNENKSAITDLLTETENSESSIKDAKLDLDTSNRAMARKEGEFRIVSKEATEARERLETVTWELNNLTTEGETEGTEKDAIAGEGQKTRNKREKTASEISERNIELRELENRHSELQSEVTEHRIHFAGLSREAEHLESRHQDADTRRQELETATKDRSAGILSCESGIEKLTEEIRTAEDRLASFEEEVKTNSLKAENLHKSGEKQSEELKAMENSLSQKRASLEELHNTKSDVDIRHTESRMQRQNQLDRITSEYGIAAEQIMEQPDPEWEDEEPSLETLETRVAELRTKIEAMGPVNLVAIEEYKEHEERYAFLTGQEEDLVKSKKQLMDMIGKINETTSEMFKTTFEAVNENFMAMFKKLFNGGTAKLVLVNEEDVLECGIEIIARPPGKRLQNVSLLSGGERTMTAVALLFAIYMIKPSPFCLLDELDAALDDSNIGRFVNVLRDFLEQSQFVVITHNRQTIAAANILYGVTMHEKGVSNVVSMKFTDHKEEAAEQPVSSS